MKNLIVILSFLLANLSLAQDNVVGEISLEEFKETVHATWFNRYYKAYQPNEKTIEKLSQLIGEREIEVEAYFGTWCPDSRRELPRLIKLLDLSGWDTNQIKLVGVNRSKEIPNASKEEIERIQLKMIPTFIILENGIEINRFVEYATETMEKDILRILEDKEYKNPYHN
ncbi:TlpA family protein disulfide reductase [Psychroflexus maritimus]|uniref:Thioredoxin family protein n=1 Tax=Psychroflexus maritimus TaxID=2714865 RepID=A0A967DZ68_9FLAO|nr:thioredoxin family protein [Psychroflexus maritimus]NGZ89883.1 thioredoxin family protein [Psychroflexus maritimus]